MQNKRKAQAVTGTALVLTKFDTAHLAAQSGSSQPIVGHDFSGLLVLGAILIFVVAGNLCADRLSVRLQTRLRPERPEIVVSGEPTDDETWEWSAS